MKRLLLAGTMLALASGLAGSAPAMAEAFDPGFSKLPNTAYVCMTAAVAIHPTDGRVYWRDAQGTHWGKITSGTRYGVGWFGGGLSINARDIRGVMLPDELTVDDGHGTYAPCQRVSENGTGIDNVALRGHK
jgi:hypothetical protein